MEDVELAKLSAECRRAQMLARPHMLYKARVWQTNLNDDNQRWACGLIYEQQWVPYCGTVQLEVHTGWGTAYPVALGPTPKAACDAFDDLWETGKADG